MNKIKVEVIGTNQEAISGITVKAGRNYFIISKSPFNGEVMIFHCDSSGHCESMASVWLGTSFEDAKKFLSEKER